MAKVIKTGLDNLHLEKMFNLPENYKEVIADRGELTPELEQEGFQRGLFVWGNRYYNFIINETQPFLVRVIEQGYNSHEQSGLIDYLLEVHPGDGRQLLGPVMNFLKQWGEENVGWAAPNFWRSKYLAEWFKRSIEIEGVEIIDYNKGNVGFYQAPNRSAGMEVCYLTGHDADYPNGTVGDKKEHIRFLTRDEATFRRTLESVSASLRALVTASKQHLLK